MVAGVVLVALGIEKTLAHVGVALDVIPAAALLGGSAVYLLAQVAFRWRNVHRFSSPRVLAAAACLALLPAALVLLALATLALLSALLSALVAYERARFSNCAPGCATSSVTQAEPQPTPGNRDRPGQGSALRHSASHTGVSRDSRSSSRQTRRHRTRPLLRRAGKAGAGAGAGRATAEAAAPAPLRRNSVSKKT